MILAASRFVPPRLRPMTAEEKVVHRTAHDLKAFSPGAVATAAPLMAALLDPVPCWLIPVPSSSGCIEANHALACAIRNMIYGARVVVGIRRKHPVESSCERRRRGRLGLSVQEHAFVRCVGPMHRMPVWFVDNVVTTGNTIKAAHLAFGTGNGLVYADASSIRSAWT
jgi:hypothetical protein